MRILTIDIETSPIVGYTWGTWNTNVIKILHPTRMLCFAAKFEGESKMHYYSEHWDGRDVMVAAAWDLLNEADVVVHYNGQKFDTPHLFREMALLGMERPSPFVQIDLLLNVRKQFKFNSNKLKDITAAFGLEGKAQHEGFGLWEKCLAGNTAAWKQMRKYNKQDVIATEGLYAHLLFSGWLPGHPSRRLYDGTPGCPTCGDDSLQKRGFAYTKVSKFQQYQCNGCGHYFRDSKRLNGVTIQGVAA